MGRASIFVAALLILSGQAFAQQTGVRMQITGLPALPPNFGPVRFADLPKLVSKLAPPVKKRFLIAPNLPAAEKVQKHSLPVQQPTYQEGSLVACF
ncbi:MAG: hypothetical protein ACUVRY_07520 [Thermoanaerobaculaceae bacterium]